MQCNTMVCYTSHILQSIISALENEQQNKGKIYTIFRFVDLFDLKFLIHLPSFIFTSQEKVAKFYQNIENNSDHANWGPCSL